MTRDVEATIEDLEFLDETGVGAIEAAGRTHFRSAQALYQWLAIERANKDLWRRLHARDPIGAPLGPPTAPTRPKENTMTDPTGTLIQRALQSPTTRLRKKGEKIRDLVDELRAALDQDDERRESEREAREEIERLERELADARARLRKPSTTNRGGVLSSQDPAPDAPRRLPVPGMRQALRHLAGPSAAPDRALLGIG